MGCDRSVHSQSYFRICFNPRTRMGCDASGNKTLTDSSSFNPRTRMGCDLTYVVSDHHAEVSIHAPAWGATSHPRICTYLLKFQSTHPHGVRPSTEAVAAQKAAFQSTHPHGVRHSRACNREKQHHVSIHAPAWGATKHIYNDICEGEFQSTHPHGVRQSNAEAGSITLVFQSTHPHGVRHSQRKYDVAV